MTSRILTGVDRDRVVLRGAALRIIKAVLEKPMHRAHGTRKDWLRPPPLNMFRRLEPLGFGLDQSEWWIFNPNDCTPDVVWPLDVGTISENTGKIGELGFQRTYTISPRDARGYASRFGSHMVRHDLAQMLDGKLATAAGLYSWIGGKWCHAEARTLWEGRDEDVAIPNRCFQRNKDDNYTPSLSTSVALRQRYEWAVSLGLEHSPSIRFATDPTGVKEVFSIRDLPEGRDRRAALMTWVSDHWRQAREDPDMEVYVRKHLRGCTKFTWQGLECELIPSQFDVDQRDKLIADRAVMHTDGIDRRERPR